MPYFPVDDDMAFHPKILAAGNEAIGMWTRAGALCKKHATGGFVSTETARALGPKRTADRLVAAGLWVVVEGGYRFHDWEQQAGNSDAETERKRADRARERNAARQAAFRARNAKSNAVTNRTGNPPVTDTPSPSPITSYVSESPSLTERARNDETNDIAARTVLVGLRIDPDRLVAHIRQRTGLAVTVASAMRVALDILDRGTDVQKPQAYVLGSISKNWQETQKFIHENALEVVA